MKMRKLLRRALCGLLCLALAGGIVFYQGGYTSSAATSAQLKEQQEEVLAKIKKLEKEIASIQGDKTDAMKQKNLLGEQIEAYQNSIENINSIIAAYEKQIREKEQLISQNQENYEEIYEALKGRIRVMYEEGNTSYLEVLFQSKSISDLLTRADVINAILKSDNRKLQDLLDTRAEIEEAKAGLETDKDEVETQKAELVSQETALAAKQAKVDSLLADLSRQEASNKKNIAALEAEGAKLAKEIAELARKSSKKEYVGGAFHWPLPGRTRISSYFGMRTHPITGVYKLHTGVDIPASKGETIECANYGTVTRATYSTAYGNYVMVDHGGGYVTLYAHMSKCVVKKGQDVSKGQKLGEVGSTGYSTGNHLHFEIIKDGNYKNPLDFFTLK